MNHELPKWMDALNEEDVQFLKRFLLASGSLKALAKEYGISYPTVRARLDRLIDKVQAADASDIKDGFHRQVQIMVADGVLGASVARTLVSAHREVMGEMKGASYEETL